MEDPWIKAPFLPWWQRDSREGNAGEVGAVRAGTVICVQLMSAAGWTTQTAVASRGTGAGAVAGGESASAANSSRGSVGAAAAPVAPAPAVNRKPSRKVLARHAVIDA